jgi:hypothetical protein
VIGVEQAADGRRHRLRLVNQPAVRDTQDPVAGELELDVSGPVAFERSARSVELVAVQLDDQALRRP